MIDHSPTFLKQYTTEQYSTELRKEETSTECNVGGECETHVSIFFWLLSVLIELCSTKDCSCIASTKGYFNSFRTVEQKNPREVFVIHGKESYKSCASVELGGDLYNTMKSNSLMLGLRERRLDRQSPQSSRRRREMGIVGFSMLCVVLAMHVLSSRIESSSEDFPNWHFAKQARRALQVASSSNIISNYGNAKRKFKVSEDMNYFVRAQNGRFVVGPRCKPFYVSGWNQWEAMEAAAGVLELYGASLPSNMTGPGLVRSLLDKAQEYGLNVLRTWAHPVSPAYALMIRPGEYRESMWRGLDYLISEARLRNVRLLLTITDNWQGTGGADDFMHWAGGELHEDFFLLERVKQLYKDHAKALLTRVNTITGIEYRNDPTIFAWNLINEPRCYPCEYDLKEWIDEMAAYVKSIDSNHMLTVGEEGFYMKDTPEAIFNPEATPKARSWADTEGQNFIEDHSSPDIDFASIHLWLSNWEDVSDKFAVQWLEQHAKDAQRLGKPLLLEEFGEWGVGKWKEERDYWYKLIYDTVAANAMDGGPFQGAMFWQWFQNGQQAPIEEGGGPGGMFGIFDTEYTFDIVKNFTNAMQKLNKQRPALSSRACRTESGLHRIKAAKFPDCSKTWIDGVPGTGFEGAACDVDINECARGLDQCHDMASCMNTIGGYRCTCFEGYAGDGYQCEPTSKLEKIYSGYVTAGPGMVACQEGQDLVYPPTAPGWTYDVTDSLSRKKNAEWRSKFGSRAPVKTPELCMIACSNTPGCDSFAYSHDQKLCFLKTGASSKICAKPESICVSVRGGTFKCGIWQTYFNKTVVDNARMVQAFEGPGALSPFKAALASHQTRRKIPSIDQGA